MFLSSRFRPRGSEEVSVVLLAGTRLNSLAENCFATVGSISNWIELHLVAKMAAPLSRVQPLRLTDHLNKFNWCWRPTVAVNNSKRIQRMIIMNWIFAGYEWKWGREPSWRWTPVERQKSRGHVVNLAFSSRPFRRRERKTQEKEI